MRPHLIAWLEALMPSQVAAVLAPSWFTCVGISGLALLLLVTLAAGRRGLDRGAVASAVLWCYIAAVVAGIVVPMLVEAAAHLFATGRVRLRWAGMTSFWGYLGGLAAVAVVCRRHALPMARLGDIAAAPLGVALACARVGCFLAGCDYGKVTSAPWAVRFPAGSPAWRDHVQQGLVPAERGQSLPVHPTQLYEALLGLAIAAIALWVARRPWARERSGRVFLVAAATYALGRIAIERFRGDTGRGIYAGLSSGQIFSILAIAAIAGGLILARRRARATIATVTTLVMLVGLHTAVAQPAPAPAPVPIGPQPAPAPAPVPFGPQPAPPPQPPPPPPPVVQPAPAPAPAAPAAEHHSSVTIGMLFGLATTLNRRPEQVPSLGGPSISIGYTRDRLGLWLDVDSYGNADASHGTLLVSAGVLTPISPTLSLGGRAGLGPTLVNFDEPAFEDVVGTSMRIEALAEYRLGESWVLWARPLSFDTLIAASLGGPITTWQVRIGLGYRPRSLQRATPAPRRP